MVENLKSCKKVVFRPFVGESIQNITGDTMRVYVFPRSGERYHLSSCYILKNGNLEILLTAELKRKRQPCKLCSPNELSLGAKVYMYSSINSIYHRKSCSAITKNYVSISKGEAIYQGYTACNICGGI